jgi:hypothetical protein
MCDRKIRQQQFRTSHLFVAHLFVGIAHRTQRHLAPFQSFISQKPAAVEEAGQFFGPERLGSTGHPFFYGKPGVLRQDVSGDKVRLQAFAGTAIDAFDRTSFYPVQISGNM